VLSNILTCWKVVITLFNANIWSYKFPFFWRVMSEQHFIIMVLMTAALTEYNFVWLWWSRDKSRQPIMGSTLAWAWHSLERVNVYKLSRGDRGRSRQESSHAVSRRQTGRWTVYDNFKWNLYVSFINRNIQNGNFTDHFLSKCNQTR
jgi:hypothetical protein